MNPRPALAVPVLAAVVLLAGCQTAYYSTMEKLGYEKRDILVDRVEEARESQQEAKEQFESALEEFLAVTGYQGGELEKRYRAFKSEFEDSEARAEEVRERIASVERVAEALFDEWQAELSQYSSASLRRSSEAQLRDTRSRYDRLIRAMKRAEKTLDPVLAAFRDRVLFLKHNLNAQAVASMKGDRAEIESDIKRLVADMNRSIDEADSFIAAMQSPA